VAAQTKRVKKDHASAVHWFFFGMESSLREHRPPAGEEAIWQLAVGFTTKFYVVFLWYKTEKRITY